MLVFREGAPPLDGGEVHRSAPVADLHAHPGLTAYWLKRDLSREHRPPAHGYNPLRQQLDLPRMQLGVLVDLSHCSDRSFADVAAMATRPLLATHTGFRRFHDIERNLSDEQLRTVARSGGVVGVITWSWLLRHRGLVADVEDLADAVVHGALVAGPGHVGIGTDFD